MESFYRLLSTHRYSIFKNLIFYFCFGHFIFLKFYPLKLYWLYFMCWTCTVLHAFTYGKCVKKLWHFIKDKFCEIEFKIIDIKLKQKWPQKKKKQIYPFSFSHKKLQFDPKVLIYTCLDYKALKFYILILNFIYFIFKFLVA